MTRSIQFAGAVSVGNCAGGPKIPFLAGRPNATMWAPSHGLLPDAGDTVDHILGGYISGAVGDIDSCVYQRGWTMEVSLPMIWLHYLPAIALQFKRRSTT